ncbi:TetR family transcriptional regulator [Gordonia malaquae]|uniref:TetR family transcriptional regulator n=1 Tax=Gordonia malaquae TaxID=410332 RepID=UPI00301B04BA
MATKAQSTRDAILDVATSAFLTRGAASTSVDAIAAAAGVTKGGVYFHFKNKPGLINAVAARALANLIADVDDDRLPQWGADVVSRWRRDENLVLLADRIPQADLVSLLEPAVPETVVGDIERRLAAAAIVGAVALDGAGVLEPMLQAVSGTPARS